MRAALERWAPWLAGVVLLAGVASYVATRLAGGSSSGPSTTSAAVVATEPSVSLSPAAASVAREFVATAVARKQLDRAWSLVTPTLRTGVTRAEWRTGSIPVLPYPVAQATPIYRVKDSRADRALLEVSFLPKPASKAQAAQYLLELDRVGGRWLVASWSPASTVGPGGSG